MSACCRPSLAIGNNERRCVIRLSILRNLSQAKAQREVCRKRCPELIRVKLLYIAWL